MSRLLSCIRRRPRYADFLTPVTAGVALYRLKRASVPEGPYTTFLSVSNVGFLDPAINPLVVDAQQTGDQVRIVIDPVPYGIPETGPTYIQLFHVDGTGAETLKSGAMLLLPDSANHGATAVAMSGTAPNGATIANSMRVDLPRLGADFTLHNESATIPLYVAFVEGGAEFLLQPNTPLPQMVLRDAPVASFWVRGSGGTCAFSATFSQASPR